METADAWLVEHAAVWVAQSGNGCWTRARNWSRRWLYQIQLHSQVNQNPNVEVLPSEVTGDA
jgi:hypothetical protein